jgi:uncharacterized protein YacL
MEEMKKFMMAIIITGIGILIGAIIGQFILRTVMYLFSIWMIAEFGMIIGAVLFGIFFLSVFIYATQPEEKKARYNKR